MKCGNAYRVDGVFCGKTYTEGHAEPRGDVTVPMEVLALKMLLEGLASASRENHGASSECHPRERASLGPVSASESALGLLPLLGEGKIEKLLERAARASRMRREKPPGVQDRRLGRKRMDLGVDRVVPLAVVSSMLFETSPYDPVLTAGSALVLLCVGVLACLLPSKRAASVDPMEAFRAE